MLLRNPFNHLLSYEIRKRNHGKGSNKARCCLRSCWINEKTSQGTIYIYISILFSITSCFSRTVHIMHIFFDFFFYTQFILMRLSITAEPFLSVESVPLHSTDFPFGSCYSDHPPGVSGLHLLVSSCQWSLVGNNIGQACTFTQPPRQKTFIKTQDVEPAKRLKCVFVKIQMSGSIWCLFKPEKLIKHYSMNRNSCVTFAQPRILLLPQWIQAAGEQILPAPNELQPIKWPLSVNIYQVKRICAFQTF